MIKLVKNELIKIFKRKSIYFMFFLSIIAIIVYNNINPDQNPIDPLLNTQDITLIKDMEETLKQKTGQEYIDYKAGLDFFKLYNNYKEDSWQRWALNEERYNRVDPVEQKIELNFNHNIEKLLNNINDYELNADTKITKEEYENSKIEYNKYIEALDTDNWKDFINLKIKDLKETKNTNNLTNIEIESINLDIEVYEMRLKYNINFDNNLRNSYVNEYKDHYFSVKFYENYPYEESQTFINKNLNECKARMNLCKYAIENNLNIDISNKLYIISDNEINARTSFIRTFEHFDLIIVIIAIYLSTTIITEEVNKKTIKNLLTKPHKRSTIIMSKLIACIITILVSMLFVIIVQYIVGGIIFGFDSYKIQYISCNYNTGDLIYMNLFQYVIIVGLSKLPMYIIIIAFCMLIGTLNNHTSMSMILTLIIFLIGYRILPIWSGVDSLNVIARYFVTNNWDFSRYLFGQVSELNGITLYSSIVVCLIHLTIFLYLTIRKFNKKEIYNT